MRKFKLFLSLLMLMAFSLGNVWAVDYELAYTLTPETSSTSGSSAYATAVDISINDVTWNVMGNTSLVPWRIGGKNLSDEPRQLFSKTAIKDNIAKIEIKHEGASSVTVNSMKVEVASNEDFSTIVSTLTPTFVATGTVEVTRPAGKDWSNCYYRITYNVTIGGSNKFIAFSEAKFYKEAEAAAFAITATTNNESYGTVALSGSVITATPEDGYRIASTAYTVTAGSATVERGTGENLNKFTVTPTTDCTVQINFETIPQYTVTWDVNGATSTSKVSEGSKPVFPATPASCDGTSTTFVGWATAPWSGKIANIDGKTVYTKAADMPAVTGAVTYYAVFAKSSGTGAFDGVNGGTFKIYALVNETKYYALGTVTSSKINPTTDAAEAADFEIEAVSGGFTIKSGDKYISYTTSTNLAAVDDPYTWSIVAGSHGSWRVNSATDGRAWIYRAGTTNKYGGYSSGNVNGTEYFDLEIGGNSSYSDYITTCCEKHTVSIASGIENGSISADLAEACEGTEVTLTANPAENYRFKSWSVNGGDVTVTDNKFTMPASDVTVSATFELKDKVTIGVNDANMGSATVNGGAGPIYVDGDVLNLVATPETGYEFVNWTSDNDEHVIFDNASSATTTATVDADVTITANFQVPAYSITSVSANDDKFGTVSLEGLVITATPADGYRFADPAYTITGGTANVAQEGNIFTVSALTADCAITINFELIPSFTASWYINGAKKGEQTAVAGVELENIPDATSIENGAIAGKVFRGWAESAIDGETDEAGAGIVATPTVMPAADKTYYAVYATEEGDAEPALSQTLSYDTWTYSGTTTDKSTYRLFGSDSQIESAEFDLTTLAQVNVYAGTFGNLSDKSVKITDGTNTWGTFTMSTKSQDTKNEVTSEVALTGTGKIYVIPNDGDGSGSGARISKVEIYTQKPISYTKYATSGPKKLANPTFSVEEGTYTETKSIELNAADGTIYYTLDGTEPTTESTPYTAAIALDAYGSYTIKAIAAKEDGSKSDVVTATYGINIPFETVTDLFTYIESGKAFLGNISVTGVVSEIVTEYSTEHSNITFNISDTGAESEAQFQSYRGVGEGIAEKVTVGDKVTITGEYTLYGTTHELKQGNTISNRVAAEVSSVVISGEATNTEYFYNDDFSFAGLVATAIYNTGYTKVVTEEANVWSATPDKVTATGNVNVTATYGGKTSEAKVVAVTKQLRTITDEQLAWTAGAATAYTVGKSYTLPTLTNELGLIVTYTSETPETATISNEEGHEGEISIVAAGSTVITASFAGNDEYAAKEVSYTLTVVAPASVVITGEASNTAYEYGYNFSFEGLDAKAVYTNEDEYEIPAAEITWAATPATVTMDNNVSVKATWEGIESAAELVAVTVKKHKVTIVQPDHGTLVVKYSKDGTPVTSGEELVLGTQLIFEITPESSDYKAGKVLVNNVPIEEMEGVIGKIDYEFSAQIFKKAEAGLEWSSTYGEIQLQGTEIVNSDLPSLTNPYGLTITYSSDDTDVAEIDPETGEITPKAEGYTAISATFAGNEEYSAAQVSFNLNVEVVAQPEFYVIGSFNNWKEFVPVYDTWYRLENLTSGNHQLKVTTTPNWSEAYGYDALTVKHAGLSKDNDGNICFTISNEINFVDIDFEKDEEGVKTFTVTGTYDKPTFTVVGVEALVGFNWGDGLNKYENEMVEDPETGNYELVKEDVMLAAGDYEYQVAMNHDWRNVPNSKLTIAESGIYTVTFTFDPSTGATSAVADLIEPIEVLPTMKIAGDWDVDLEDPNKWNENELIVAGDEKTASYTATNLVSGTWYHFWIIKNGVYMSGNNGFDRENLSADLSTYNTGNDSFAMYFQADQDGDYTFTWTYETNVITMTFPYKEPTALDNTEAGETAVKVMQNGQLLIIKNGKTYNAQGAVVK